MNDLTPKREAFAQAVANGNSQADAYRASFNASKMKAETIQQEACRLMADYNVSARVVQLREALSDKGLWTREQSVEAMRKIAEGGNVKANDITSAVRVLNEMHGFNAPKELKITGNLNINVNFD